MRWMERLDSLLECAERFFICVLFLALILILAGNILGRNLVGYFPQKLMEMVPAIVMWLTLVGASLALRKHRHIGFDVMLRVFPPHAKRLMKSVSCVAGGIVMALLVLASVFFALIFP